MKKKKGKPRQLHKYCFTNTVQEKTFKYYIKEMEEKQKSFQLKSNLNVKFNLIQTKLGKDKIIDKILNLAYFYDTNYTGNKDFIRIPTVEQMTHNFMYYPIMIATQKNEYEKEEILGATIIKIYNNTSISDNPYFPAKNENVLCISGVLTKFNAVDKFANKIRGIGKELYKSAIKGAYKLNKETKIRLICEVDCRNINSIKSVSNAVKELQQEGISVNINIPGYYEIYNKTKELKEAPTFVLEIDLNEQQNNNQAITKFSYLQCDLTNLFPDLVKVIKSNVKENNSYININDKEMVVYHSIEPINALNIEIEVGETAEGNNRAPLYKVPELQYVEKKVL